MAYSSFEDLEVWKRACGLAVLVYRSLEKSNEFGMRNQMQRSAVSIASNRELKTDNRKLKTEN
jgi:four helix bundle protein